MVDYNVRVGPFVVCKTGKAEKTKTLFGCVKCKKSKERHLGFCDKCGTKLGEFVVTYIDDKVDDFEVMEHIKDRLFTANVFEYSKIEGVHVYLSNIKYGEKREADVGPPDFNGMQEIDPRDVPEEIVRFETRFEKDLKYMRSLYASVEVKWGILAWCS